MVMPGGFSQEPVLQEINLQEACYRGCRKPVKYYLNDISIPELMAK